MSGGTGQTQNIDPDIKSRQLGLYNDVTSYLNQTPYQAYGGPLVAGQQPFQQAAQNFLGQQLFGQSLGFQAPQTFGPYQAADFEFGTQNPSINLNTGLEEGGTATGGTGTGGSATGSDVGDAIVDAYWPGYQPPTTANSMVSPLDGGFQLWPGTGTGQNDPVALPGDAGFPLTPNDPGGSGQPGSGVVIGTGGNYQPGTSGPQMPQGFQPPGFSQNAFASNVAQGLTGFTPQQVQGGQFTGQRLAELQNPYQQQVIDQSISDLDRARQIAMQSGPGSSSAGSYGGSRTGVREAETNRAFLDSVARQSAQLRSAGFDRAAGLLGQELGMGLSANLANQSAGLQGAGLNLGAAQSLNQFGGDALNRTLGVGSALNQIGAQNQQLAQRQIDADYGQFQQARNWPLQGFGLQQGVLSGLPVGMNFNSGSNPGAGFTGGALSGAGIGSAFGPWGAGLGALGGGLLGLLG